MSSGVTLWSEATKVKYPDGSVDKRGRAFWNTLRAEVRE